MSAFSRFRHWNVLLSNRIDHLLPQRWREDGNKAFLADVLPHAVKNGDVIYDLGGGSRPFISLDEKKKLGATVVGLDIDAGELYAAPKGIYDQVVVQDLCTFEGPGNADVVICQALLEHVPDTAGAMRAMASTVKPGGRIFIFAPSRNALFARLNLLLPERVKHRLLFSLFPQKAHGHDGFKAYYNLCTPSKIEAVAAENDLVVEVCRVFWTSSYFAIFTPAFLFWRLFQGLSFLLIGRDAAESFIYVLRKSDLRKSEPTLVPATENVA